MKIGLKKTFDQIFAINTEKTYLYLSNQILHTENANFEIF